VLSAACGAATLAGALLLSPVATTTASAATRATVTFTVNSIADRPDAAHNGVCATAAPVACTLRAAIQEADAAAGPATIAFAIPGTGVHTIAPASQLPVLTNSHGGITVNGYTQPGSHANTATAADNAVLKIELKGKGPSGIDGLVIQSAGNTIQGIDIHGFRHSIYMNEASSASNVIVGDIVGLLPNGAYDGSHPLVAGSSCIIMQGGAHDNVIGRPNLADRNTIGGCSHQGIATYEYPTTRNVIQNNIIGLDPTGTQQRENRANGVDINTGTTLTIIGGTGLYEHNVSSGNVEEGIEISHIPATSDNFVLGNYIGTNLTATGFAPYTRNHGFGVNLEGRGTCNNQVCPSDAHNNVVENNVIVNSGIGGVMIDKGQNHDTVANNRIGILPNGAAAPNALYGLRIEAGAYSNTIGPGNIIANNGAGIQLQATGTQPANPTESPTNFNTFTRNSIYGNASALGIDFIPYNSLNTTTDPNVNEGVLAPKLSSPTKTSVTVKTCANCTIELFISSKPAGQQSQGKTFLATGKANAAGTLVLKVPAAGVGHVVTADTTTPKLSTSEFSLGIAIP
jgi:CSLREA domain-containing protein